MPRMRTTTRLLINGAAVAALALSGGLALAAQRPEGGGRSAAERAALDAAAERAAQAGAKRSADRGRVKPIVGRPDYGSAEARFGAARSGHVHAGQDLFARAGTPVVAVADGVIAERGSDAGQGNYVYLYDRRRERTYVYMHLIAPALPAAGTVVRAGERLGGVGCSGSCWGDHLHFEVRAGRGITGKARDPLPGLSGWRSLERPR
jgi:murein DD-endopeptidase MepM/ murein hydrolase activator NlpD